MNIIQGTGAKPAIQLFLPKATLKSEGAGVAELKVPTICRSRFTPITDLPALFKQRHKSFEWTFMLLTAVMFFRCRCGYVQG